MTRNRSIARLGVVTALALLAFTGGTVVRPASADPSNGSASRSVLAASLQAAEFWSPEVTVAPGEVKTMQMTCPSHTPSLTVVSGGSGNTSQGTVVLIESRPVSIGTYPRLYWTVRVKNNGSTVERAYVSVICAYVLDE